MLLRLLVRGCYKQSLRSLLESRAIAGEFPTWGVHPRDSGGPNGIMHAHIKNTTSITNGKASHQNFEARLHFMSFQFRNWAGQSLLVLQIVNTAVKNTVDLRFLSPNLSDTIDGPPPNWLTLHCTCICDRGYYRAAQTRGRNCLTRGTVSACKVRTRQKQTPSRPTMAV
jgi:hypothetical protein